MDFLSQVDPIAIAALTFAAIGLVRLYNAILDNDWRAAGSITVSAVVGILASQFVGVSYFNGFLIGLNATGLFTTALKIGGK